MTIEITSPALRPAEVQKLLAISRSTMHRLIATGTIPAFRVGDSETGAWRILRDDLQTYVSDQLEQAKARFTLPEA